MHSYFTWEVNGLLHSINVYMLTYSYSSNIHLECSLYVKVFRGR